MPNKKSALFLLDSQPPHWGELVSVLLKMKEYDFMNVCISGISKGTSVRTAIASWLFVLEPYKKRVTVSALKIPFEELPELPEQFKDCTVLTTSRTVFIHFSSLNVPVELVPRALGYHGVFIRTAIRQGRALDWLLGKAAHNVKHVPKELTELEKNDTNVCDK